MYQYPNKPPSPTGGHTTPPSRSQSQVPCHIQKLPCWDLLSNGIRESIFHMSLHDTTHMLSRLELCLPTKHQCLVARSLHTHACWQTTIKVCSLSLLRP